MQDVDPIELSRTFSRAEDAAWAWLDSMRELADAEDAPLQMFRPVSCQQFHDELRADLHPSDPLKPFLFRWLTHLLELRVNWALHAEIAHQRYHEIHHLEAPERISMSLDAIARKVFTEPRRAVWLKELDRRGQPLEELTTQLWQRRVEVYSRLRGPSLDEAELPCPEVYALANTVLTATAPLTTELGGLVRSLEHTAKPSPLTFPARLGPPSLADWFRETRLLESVNLRPFTWPKPVGGTSFGVALERFGYTWHRALAPKNQPFVVACDPRGLAQSNTGWLFAGLLASPAFQRRHLGGAPSKQRDVQRFWGFVGVHELRLRALRVLLRQALQLDHRERPKAIEHLHERVWGQPPGRHLLGVLPQLRSDDAQRLCAVGLATLRAETLTEAHNEDWFRNPRAVEELRSQAETPPEFTAPADTVSQGLTRYVAQLTTMIA